MTEMKKNLTELIGILETLIQELKVLEQHDDKSAIPISTIKLHQALKQIKKDEDNRAQKILNLIKERRDATQQEEADILEMKKEDKNDTHS